MSRSGYEPQVAASASSSHGGSSSPRAMRMDSRSPKRHSTYAASSAGIAARIASIVSIPKAIPFPSAAAAATTASAMDIALAEILHGHTIDSGPPKRQRIAKRLRPRLPRASPLVERDRGRGGNGEGTLLGVVF